jgi:hypothetical protein
VGTQALALLATLDIECRDVEQLGEVTAAAFQQHPDYTIITSFPGLADNIGAWVLAEIGDDRARFADARAVKAYAGSVPITRASGRSISISHRRVKTTGWPRPDGAGPSSGPAAANQRNSTTGTAATTEIAMPLRCAICSTALFEQLYHRLANRTALRPREGLCGRSRNSPGAVIR